MPEIASHGGATPEVTAPEVTPQPAPADKAPESPMSQEDIDATQAPLIEHLIELRQRLIYCLIGFVAAFA